MSEFNLATADKHELKFYANNSLGMNLSKTMSEDTMRKRILEHCETEGLEAPKSEVTQKGGGAHVKKEPWATINISKQDRPGGSDPAFVGVNGVGYTIPRGINIDVPPSVVEVLRNAKQDIVTQDPDTGQLLHEDVYTYNFQVIQEQKAS